MCPTPETNGTNGHTNGHANGVNGNGNETEYTAIPTKHNPHPHQVSPYQPVQDFLSNVGRFKIIGMHPILPRQACSPLIRSRVDPA